MNINMEHLKTAFQLMGFGMGGVFLVLFILFIASQALLKLFPVKKKKD